MTHHNNVTNNGDGKKYLCRKHNTKIIEDKISKTKVGENKNNKDKSLNPIFDKNTKKCIRIMF